MHPVLIRCRRQAIAALIAVVAILVGVVPKTACAFDLFATHEVTVHFATQDGKPMADTAVRVFAPDDPHKPVVTGRTDAQGAFRFSTDRDGFWSAEADDAGHEVARVMIRVGGAPATAAAPVSPAVVIGALVALLVLAFAFHLLRARNRRAARRR